MDIWTLVYITVALFIILIVTNAVVIAIAYFKNKSSQAAPQRERLRTNTPAETAALLIAERCYPARLIKTQIPMVKIIKPDNPEYATVKWNITDFPFMD